MVLNGEKGKYGYIPDIMSVYRFWGSVWGKRVYISGYRAL